MGSTPIQSVARTAPEQPLANTHGGSEKSHSSSSANKAVASIPEDKVELSGISLNEQGQEAAQAASAASSAQQAALEVQISQAAVHASQAVQAAQSVQAVQATQPVHAVQQQAAPELHSGAQNSQVIQAERSVASSKAARAEAAKAKAVQAEQVAEARSEQASRQSKTAVSTLSQIQLMKSEGDNVTEIAVQLNLTPKAVEQYLNMSSVASPESQAATVAVQAASSTKSGA